MDSNLHRALIVSFLMFCLAGLSYGRIRNPEAFKKQQEERLAQLDHPWLKGPFPLNRGYGNIDMNTFDVMWKNLANFSYAFSKFKQEEVFKACRQALMAICSYPKWSDQENDLNDPRSAWVGLAILTTLDHLGEHLPATERQRVIDRLETQMHRYKRLLDGVPTTDWWAITNDPTATAHHAFLVACSQLEKLKQHPVARECRLHAMRSLQKTFNLNDSTSPLKASTAWPESLLGDWVRLWLIHRYPESFDHIDHLPWAKQRLAVIKAKFEPGRQSIWLPTSTHPESWTALAVPVTIGLSSLSQDQDGLFLGSELQQAFRNSWNPWLYSTLTWLKPKGTFSFRNDLLRHQDEASGLYIYRDALKESGSHITFRCGSPLTQQVFEAWKVGRQDLRLEAALPHQGNWTWSHNQKLILGNVSSSEPSTPDFNTLMINGQGQWFEAYPKRRAEGWKHKAQPSQLFLNEQFGSSWLVGGEFSGAYPQATGLNSHVKVILVLSPKMIIELQSVELDSESDIQTRLHSPDYPLQLRPDGFYQKVTGFQTKTTSWPKGSWDIRYQQDERGRDVATAVHSVKSQSMIKCSVMAPSDLLQDLWVQRSLEEGISLDFYRGLYRVQFKFESGSLKTHVKVFNKTFYELSTPLP